MTLSSIPVLLACVASFLASGNAFLCPHAKITTTALQASTSQAETAWQNDVDEFLNVDTSCATRRSNVLALLQKSREIVGDLTSAIRTRDIKKIAPPELKYGKAVQGIQAVRRQVLNDIIPGSLTKGIPRLIEEGPKIVQKAGSVIRTLPEKGRDAIGSIRDMTQDPSMLQYNLDSLRKEMRNVVQSTPEGLDTPTYEVLKKTDSYEVRSYGGYSVCSTAFTGGDGSEMADPLAAGNSFTELAGYIFGEEMAMTTPVICGSGAMEFVLPRGTSAANAPVPKSDAITVKDVPAEVLAVREFPGFATDGEVSRQRAMLEDALLTDGIVYDNLSLRVFQYNPPQTLPWLRRNEVAIKVDMSLRSNQEMLGSDGSKQGSGSDKNNFVSKDESEFMSAPEAGD